MMIVIDSGLAVIEMWRRNPLGVAVSGFYCPPTFINDLMVGLQASVNRSMSVWPPWAQSSS
jgi:hypothetical protein